MSGATFDERAGSVAQQARSFLARAKEAAGDFVERVKELSEEVMWINHFALAPARTGLMVAHDAVGTGLSGLVVSPRTAAPRVTGDGYVLETGLEVPPGFFLRGIRIGLEASSAECCLSLIRLSQVNDPPTSAILLCEDDRKHRAVGAVAIEAEGTPADPRLGPVLLTLGFTFGDPGGWVVIRAVGMRLSRSPA
jgi:hypothetical protein